MTSMGTSTPATRPKPTDVEFDGTKAGYDRNKNHQRHQRDDAYRKNDGSSKTVPRDAFGFLEAFPEIKLQIPSQCNLNDLSETRDGTPPPCCPNSCTIRLHCCQCEQKAPCLEAATAQQQGFVQRSIFPPGPPQRRKSDGAQGSSAGSHWRPHVRPEERCG